MKSKPLFGGSHYDSWLFYIDAYDTALEAFFGLFLLTHIFQLKPLLHRKIFIVIYYAAYSCLMIWQDMWGNRHSVDIYPFFLLLHVVLLFLFGLIFCEGKLIFKFFLPLVFVSLITLSGSPVIILLQFSHYAPEFIAFDALFPLLSRLTLFLITIFLIYFKIDANASCPFSYYITMTVAPVINMMSITMLKEYSAVFPYLHLVGCFTLILELLIYYMIWQSAGAYARNTELSLIRQQQEYQIRQMEEVSHIVADYHQLRHDMKNHFACMDRYLSQKKYQELKDYFYSFSNALYSLDNQIETGNEIANQVINIKYATAHQLGIPMEINAVLPRKLNIPDYLFCAVLSNLLDNAIEASEKIQNPAVFVKLHMVKNYLSITVKNRIESWQHESALSRKTTKSNPHLHGIGLRIVEETVKAYNGISSYEIVKNDSASADGSKEVFCMDTDPAEYVASVMLELDSV